MKQLDLFYYLFMDMKCIIYTLGIKVGYFVVQNGGFIQI